MSEKTESEVLSLAESDDSDSEEVINVISDFFSFMIFRSIFQFRLRLEVFEPMLFIMSDIIFQSNKLILKSYI